MHHRFALDLLETLHQLGLRPFTGEEWGAAVRPWLSERSRKRAWERFRVELRRQGVPREEGRDFDLQLPTVRLTEATEAEVRRYFAVVDRARELAGAAA